MSWTDVDKVKTHLQAFCVDALKVRFFPLVLSGTDLVQLPNNTLMEASEKLYSLQSKSPSGPIEIELINTVWISIGSEAVFPDSVVVASEQYAKSRYIEGLDFAIDYENGKIKRFSSGDISSGDTVYCWFLPVNEFSRNIDYDLDEIAGKIKRIASGSIPDPGRVYISYSTSAAGATDALINLAINEAETKIIRRLSSDYSEESDDPSLIIGATEYTISLICDDMAVRALTSVGDSSADDRSRRFMELALRYESRALSTLSPFLRHPLPSTSKPGSNSSRINRW